MRWLIDYIRECFCKHEWECIAEKIAVYDVDTFGVQSNFPIYHKWIYVCKKCKKVKEVRT